MQRNDQESLLTHVRAGRTKGISFVIYYTKLEFLPNIFCTGDDRVLFLSVALFTNWFSEDDY